MRRHGCCLSRVRDYSHLFTGSPSLPDKYRHSREMMMLLPAHRDRPSSAMYPTAIMENGQVADLFYFMSVQPPETLFLLFLTTLKLPFLFLESTTWNHFQRQCGTFHINRPLEPSILVVK